MKGYRTPSWFRMKGFRNRKVQDKVRSKRAKTRISEKTDLR
jgi:hypothetical protein